MGRRDDPYATSWRPPSAPLFSEDQRPRRERRWGRRVLFAVVALSGLAALGAAVGEPDNTVTVRDDSDGVFSLPVFDIDARTDARADVTADVSADVQLERCELDGFGLMRAEGVLTSRSDSMETFTIQVVFERGDLRVGEGLDMIPDLEPGRSATWDVMGLPDETEGVTCRVQRVSTFP